jgi:sensor c-di-GMP phosphodiesterase-like protein
MGPGQRPCSDPVKFAIAYALSLKDVGEGVKIEAQDGLRANGSDHPQGFLFTRPMPADVLEGMINDK